jgi:hypothetical protein
MLLLLLAVGQRQLNGSGAVEVLANDHSVVTLEGGGSARMRLDSFLTFFPLTVLKVIHAGGQFDITEGFSTGLPFSSGTITVVSTRRWWSARWAEKSYSGAGGAAS